MAERAAWVMGKVLTLAGVFSRKKLHLLISANECMEANRFTDRETAF